MLHEFIDEHAGEIIAQARAKVAARTDPVPTEVALKNGVPLFLGQLVAQLRRATTDSGAIQESATQHGKELLQLGFSVSQVVHGYGDICQIVTKLATNLNVSITTDEFHTFNLCLDEAIANSVTEYEHWRDESVAYEGVEKLGTLAHEMRNRLSAAMLAYELLQKGTVGIGGSTGAVLGRNLRALRDLINNSIAGVRVDAGLAQHHRVWVSDIVAEVKDDAAIGADLGGFRLVVTPVQLDAEVDVDPQILEAAIGNLIQNAFKFTRAHSTVTLRTRVTARRVRFEVEDQCGGLPPGKAEDLFRSFEQRGLNRKGLGLGLAISRKAVEAVGGRLTVRDLPLHGCIFKIDLPRLLPKTKPQAPRASRQRPAM